MRSCRERAIYLLAGQELLNFRPLSLAVVVELRKPPARFRSRDGFNARNLHAIARLRREERFRLSRVIH